MASYIRSVLRNRVTIAVSAVDDTQLPPNPISHLLVTIRFQTAAANVMATLLQVLATIAQIDVLHRGTSVFSMRGQDLWAYMIGCGMSPAMPFRNTDPVNSSGFVTLVLPFGRQLYDPNECFPCTRAGELLLRITRQAADTALTGVTFTVASVELPDAQPKRFLRATTLAQTPSATGDFDFQLYPSTVYLGLLVFSTTVPTGTVFTTSADRFQLLLNNLQYDIAQANFEDLWGEWVNRGGLSSVWLEHFHTENQAVAYAQLADTLPGRVVAHPLRQYLWIDFDPTRDLLYAIDARNIARVALRINAGDTNAIRVMPQEMIFLDESGGS